MWRFLIFGLLGPAACCVIVFCLGRGVIRWGELVQIVYPIALVPFLLCAWIDRHLKQVPSWERAVIAAAAGFFTSALALLIVGFVYFDGQTVFMVFGLAAAIPAAACSWLSTLMGPSR